MIKSILGTGFHYEVELVDRHGHTLSRTIEHNIIPQQGLDHIASLIRGGGASPISDWYIGVFENNYVPVSSVTASDLQSPVGESSAYSGDDRLPWDNSYDGQGMILSSPRAEFEMTDEKRIYGAFIVSSPSRGGTSGTLLSIARFSSPRDVEDGATLRVSAGLLLTPTNNL